MSMTESQFTLQPMFKDAPAALGRLLPVGKATYLGLRARFCDLRDFFSELKEKSWSGHLYATSDGARAHVLFVEGQVALAVCRDQEADLALQAFEGMWADGASLSGFRLEDEVALALSGVMGASDSGQPDSQFSGAFVGNKKAELYVDGRLVGSMPIVGVAEGMYRSGLGQPVLVLSEPVAEWMKTRYVLTLRGRDALSPITPLYNALKREMGTIGRTLLEHLRSGSDLSQLVHSGLTETEVAKTTQQLLAGGYIHVEE